MKFSQVDINKMRDFFYEHPIQFHSVEDIAEYLDMDVEYVKSLLQDMWQNGLIIPIWKISKSFLYNESCLRGHDIDDEEDE